jgi:hypothetical protein
MKERKVRRSLEPFFDDPAKMERIFEILKNQNEY